MKPTKIPISVSAIRKDLDWTCVKLKEVLGTEFPPNPIDPNLQRLARIAPYFKMYRSNPDWNL